MRTTLNLDDDVVSRLGELKRSTGRSLSRVTNDILRLGLGGLGRSEPMRPYHPPAFDTGRPRFDVTDVSEVLDRLDRDVG